MEVPTIISLILAGKIGSNIASEIGTMRVTEQIDALEVMGVNSLNYLVFPKIIASLLYPFLIGIAMFLGILGGWIAVVYGGFVASNEFVTGLQTNFIPCHITYAFIKKMVFKVCKNSKTTIRKIKLICNLPRKKCHHFLFLPHIFHLTI